MNSLVYSVPPCSPPVLNWRCWLKQVDLYNGRRTVVVVVAMYFPASVRVQSALQQIFSWMTANIIIINNSLLGLVSRLFQCRTRLCWLVVRLLRLPGRILLKCQVSCLAFGHRALSLSSNTYPNRRGRLVPRIWHRCCGSSCQTLLQQRTGLHCSTGQAQYCSRLSAEGSAII